MLRRASSGYGYPQRSNRGQGLKIRLIIALAIAAFSFMSYLNMSHVNPITGEKQRVAMTEQQEIQLGLQAMPEMIQQHHGEHRDQRAQAAVDQVGNRLLAALNQWVESEGKTNPYQYDFHLLADEKTINAFALPGGQVFITYALFSQLETEGQLAGVLGHEIGHVISRHGAQRLAKQKLSQGLAGAAGVFGGSYDSARMAQAALGMVSMKYGRQDELESDEWGVKLCVAAGYDPRAMIGVMDILERSTNGQAPPEMFSTHPKPGNRREHIANVIKRVFPDGLPDNLRP